MKNNFLVFLILFVCALVAVFIYWYPRAAPPPAPVPALAADTYPLYSGAQWGAPHTASFALGTSSVEGVEVDAEPVINTFDLAAVSLPFETYYQTKLNALGWVEDTSLAAGGPGSGISAYRKGSALILTIYDTVFKNGGTSTPETCPCDITLSLFTSTQ